MIKIDPSDFISKMAKLEPKMKAGATLAGKVAADKMKNEAKANASWTDRTGEARRTIGSFAEWKKSNELHIGISGNVEYFEHLELDHGKRYAILYPTILRNKNKVVSQMKKIL